MSNNPLIRARRLKRAFFESSPTIYGRDGCPGSSPT